VPPATRIVGGAVEHLVADIGMLEADTDELHQIVRREPDREPAAIDGRVAEIADADAGHAQPMLERVERAERFAKRLAHAVAGVRTQGGMWADPARARIEADHVVRGSEYHAPHALAARRLEQVVAADDVGLQDRLPRPFDRESAEMHDAFDACDRRLD